MIGEMTWWLCLTSWKGRRAGARPVAGPRAQRIYALGTADAAESQAPARPSAGSPGGDKLLAPVRDVPGPAEGVDEQARRVLLRDAPAVLEDKVWRAYGLLRYAGSLSFEETLSLLSGVSLGVGLNLIPDLGVYTLNKLMIYAQPAHLAHVAGRALSDPDLAIARATFVRRLLEDEAGRQRPETA